MTEELELPFLTVLNELETADPLPLELLYRLSDLSADDFAAFCEWLPQTADERRRVLMRHLADISEENFVVDFAPIFAFAMNDVYAPVRQAALDGVWDATDVTLVKPIIALMQTDASDDVRAAAAAALGHYVLLAEWGQLPAHISPPIIEALLATYDDEETAVPLKRAALEALGTAHHPRIAQLIEQAYEDRRFEMQLSAVFAMGGSADSRWLPIILDEMENPAVEMRVEAARAAGLIGGSDAVEALANLVVDSELSVAVMAVDAMGQIGGDRAQSILASILDDLEFEQLHEAVSEALEELAILGGDVDFDWIDFDED